MNMCLDNIEYKEESGIGYLYLKNLPANIMTEQFFSDFSYVISNIKENLVKGIIIAGKGRHFSSGVDMDMLKQMIHRETLVDECGNITELSVSHLRDKNSFLALNKMSIPVVSVIGGFAIGSGFEICLNSHIRICEKNARVGLPESTFGLLPAMGGIPRSIEIVGLTNSLTTVLSGEIYNASDAYQMGLVDLVVDKKQGIEFAEKLIKYITWLDEEYDKEKVLEYIEKHILLN